MEGKKQVGSSSTSFSFTTELFGSNDSSSSSSAIFASIFAPSSKVLGRESIRPGMVSRKQNSSANEACKSRFGSSDNKRNEGDSQSSPDRDTSFEYRHQRVQQPCHLSSSIYYGGQDIYHHPEDTHSSSVNTLFKKDVTEDDPGSASRGNWWQGSLYY